MLSHSINDHVRVLDLLLARVFRPCSRLVGEPRTSSHVEGAGASCRTVSGTNSRGAPSLGTAPHCRAHLIYRPKQFPALLRGVFDISGTKAALATSRRCDHNIGNY